MSMTYDEPRRGKRSRKNRILLILAMTVLFVGLFLQITMLARISARGKQAEKIEQEIVELNAHAQNLELSINQYHNVEVLTARAEQLGMYTPTQEQIRVVNVDRSIDNTTTQSVEAIGGEKVLN